MEHIPMAIKLLALDDETGDLKEVDIESLITELAATVANTEIQSDVPGMISAATSDFLDQTEVDARISNQVPPMLTTFQDASEVTDLINSLVPGIADDTIFDEFNVGNNAGRITLSNGFYVEWGVVTWSDTTQTAMQSAVTFINTFSYYPNIQLSHNSYSGNWVHVSATGLSTTGFTAGLVRGSSSSATLIIRWIATGKRSGY
jgi:hypothetical protein